jgi:hypothetical protein
MIEALQEVKKEKKEQKFYAKEVRIAVRGLEQYGEGLNVVPMPDFVAVADAHAMRLFHLGTAEANALLSMLADLGKREGGFFRILSSGPEVGKYVREGVGPKAVAKILEIGSLYTASVVERVEAAKPKQFPKGLVRVVAEERGVSALLDARKVVPFKSAAAVLVGPHSYSPVRFVDAEGQLLGVLMPLNGVAVAE